MRPTEDEEACLRRAYSAHTAEFAPVFDCQYEATTKLQDCMRPLLSTCPPDPEASSECSTTYTEESEACPEPSEQAQAELAACYASRT